jgi:hypothetical protein
MKVSLIAVNNIIVVTYCSKCNRLSLSLIPVNETPIMGRPYTSSSESRPCWTWPGAFSSPPRPTQKTPPSTNQLCGPPRGFVPGTNKRPRVCVVKNTYLKPSCHRVGKQRPSISHTKRNPTCAHTMGHDYPITHLSPGVYPSIHPPSPGLEWRDLPEDRIPKNNLFIFSFEHVHFPLSHTPIH